MTSLELVVARCTEDLSWLRRVPKSVRATVYNKGGEAGPGTPLPNVGREAHTYLHHLVERYDDLADVTAFCQGKPFDHVPDLHKTLRKLASGEMQVDGFLWLGFLIDRDDRTGSLLFQNWTKNAERRPLPLDIFWKSLWGGDPPESCVFYPGGNFIVTRDRVRRQPRAFYEKALRVSEDLADAAHCYERVWDRVFGVNGIPEQYRAAPLPVYFKPIRRLIAHGGGPRPPGTV